MGLFNTLFKKRKKVEDFTIEKSPIQIKPDHDEDEIAAVIAAAVAAMDEEDEIVAAITAAVSVILGKGPGELIVRNIKRTPEMDSIWAHVGRIQLMR